MKFRTVGTTFPAIEIVFDAAGEEMLTQKGGMAWMSDGIKMETEATGGLFASVGRMFSGESVFMNRYKALKAGTTIAFASTVPGSIYHVDMAQYPHGILCQKGAFLCSQTSVELKVAFTKKIGAGLFGGEGFVLQNLTGQGHAFLEVDGSAVEKILGPGEVLKVDTGNVVAFSADVRYEIETVPGIANKIFGGEGLFLTKLTGPGKVVLQTMSLPELAASIKAYLPSK